MLDPAVSSYLYDDEIQAEDLDGIN